MRSLFEALFPAAATKRMPALFASWIAQRPATAQRSFGFMRLEVFAALVNGAVLIVIAIGIGIEAWRRVQAPPAVNGALLLGVAGIAIW